MDATAFCSNHVWKRWFWPQKLSMNATRFESAFWNAVYSKSAFWNAVYSKISMDATAFCSNHVWKRWFWPQKLSINAPSKCIVFRMKLRNAALQWKHSWHSSYSRYWEIDDKRDNSRKAFRNAFRITIWLWVLKRVSTAKVRSETRLSQKHVLYIEMINTKLFWNAFTMCPRKKQNPETMEKGCGMCYTIFIFISWSMINMLSNDT